MGMRGRKIVPVVGGVTAAATAVGAFAPATQVAVAAPDNVDGAVGTLGVAQDGVFESCSAYFGFGKEEGAVGVVDFDVADVSGSDGAAHDVPDDVDVVLVLENDEGDVLECVPEEVTEEQWDAFLDDNPFSFPAEPDWPGTKRFAYPLPSLEPDLGEWGELTSVGFRVVGVPTGHELVSPEGVQQLADHFAFVPTMFSPSPDASDLLDAVEAAAGSAAADALGSAIAGCAGEAGVDPDPTDEDLVAAISAVGQVLGYPGGPLPEDFDCSDVFEVFILGSHGVAVLNTAAYQEPIRLSVQAPEPSTPTTPTTAPAAQGAQAARVTPTYTG